MFTSGPSTGSTIELSGVRFRYPSADGFELSVPSLVINRGTVAACIGPSGSGKSTMLDLIAGRLVPDSGRIAISGTDIASMNRAQSRRFRLMRIGMVAQTLALVAHLTAMENILLAAMVAGVRPLPRGHANALAERLGVSHLLSRRPGRLSQGERQRIAICRALLLKPDVLLCDEPTGNLDPDRSRGIVGMLVEAAAKDGTTVLLTTHDHSLLDLAHLVIDMADLREPGTAGVEP